MKCPHCQNECNALVLETRKQDGDILRKRACGSCGNSFLTAERPDVTLVMRRDRPDKKVDKPAEWIPSKASWDAFNVWN